MKQSVSWYVMPHQSEASVASVTKAMGLDGIENLIYSNTPSDTPFQEVTVGVHLKYWPSWMDFYKGHMDRVRMFCPDDAALERYYGGTRVEDWISYMRGNIGAALAEKPEYLVWHVAECLPAETWTRRFAYTHKEVLKATAEVYREVADMVPSTVQVLFENIFWPGLDTLEYDHVSYFFSLLPEENMGIMLDTGHMMNTMPGLTTEAEGARYIESRMAQLGDQRHRVKGIHLSASLSGVYRAQFPMEAPDPITGEVLLHHISSIDEHRPFETSAAKDIVDCVEPQWVTHELFGSDEAELKRKIHMQKKAMEGHE